MTIEIHNPVFGFRDVILEKGRVGFPSLAEGETLRVVFIDNEKPNTTHLLEKVAEGLKARFEVSPVHLYKGGAAHPASDDLIGRAAEIAHIAVLATAD